MGCSARKKNSYINHVVFTVQHMNGGWFYKNGNVKEIFVLYFNNTEPTVISVIVRHLALALTKRHICF
jgi:hypothetical protein